MAPSRKNGALLDKDHSDDAMLLLRAERTPVTQVQFDLRVGVPYSEAVELQRAIDANLSFLEKDAAKTPGRTAPFSSIEVAGKRVSAICSLK